MDSYIEVKTTVSHEKSYFEVTLAELDWARRHLSAYTITRVFGAGSGTVHIASLQDPAEYLGNGLTLLVRPDRAPAMAAAAEQVGSNA